VFKHIFSSHLKEYGFTCIRHYCHLQFITDLQKMRIFYKIQLTEFF